MDDLDQNAIMELATAIARHDCVGAFMALDVIVRDHPHADTIRGWIDTARFAATR